MKKLFVLILVLSLFSFSFISAIDYSIDSELNVKYVDYVGDFGDFSIEITNNNNVCDIACSWEVLFDAGIVSEGKTDEILNRVTEKIQLRLVSSGTSPNQFTFSIRCWDVAQTWPCNEESSKAENLQMSFEYCGNDKLNSNYEECDGNNLNGQNCMTQGFEGGELTCSNCRLDKSDCYKCGDEEINQGEECDGSDLGGKSCLTLGYTGGNLGCTSCSLDKSECYKCGDGNINLGEECDGNNLGGKSCESLGYLGGGILGCGNSCQYSKVGCQLEKDNSIEEINTRISEVSEEIAKVGETIKETSEDNGLNKTKSILGIIVALCGIGVYVGKVYFWDKARKKKKQTK